MIYAKIGDITEVKTEVICSAANGVAVMGAGVAGAIRNACGDEMQVEAKNICKKNGSPIEAGNCYITSAGKLVENGIKYVYHIVTMTYPGGQTSLKIISDAWREALRKAIVNKIKSISVTGLGIGIGHLDFESVARDMVNIAKQYAFTNDIDIYFIDRDKNFIDKVLECIKT